MANSPVWIVDAKRTPIGAFQGALASHKAPALAAHTIAEILKVSHLVGNEIDEVFMGCVLTAGLGQAPARQAALFGGIENSVPCTTLNKVCGSGMKAIMLGIDQIRLGHAQIVISGGMESMTNAPYLLDRARGGYRLGHGRVIDHLFLDGLEDAYHNNRLMGTFADDTADFFQFTSKNQDEFAVESLHRSLNATQEGAFKDEIVPFDHLAEDETPQKVRVEKIPLLKPAFRKDGTVTSASSSSIADGAAAVLLMSETTLRKSNLAPLVRICGHASHAQEPEWFTTAPVGAIQKLCDQLGWSLDSVDYFEINEAFAVVTMATMKKMGIPHGKVNVHGGACSLGHPIGASGARIVVTLAHTMRQKKAKRGIAAICIGGGEATALAVECA